MSQPDLVAQLSGVRPVAPAELRERVRTIAAGAAPRPGRLTWRRAVPVAIALAAATVAAVTLIPGGANRQTAPRPLPVEDITAASGIAKAPSIASGSASSHLPKSIAPAPSTKRLQRYSASLQLRLADTRAVSDATKRALRIAAALGGYPSRVNVDAAGSSGYATIVLRIPVGNVQKAVTRLSALGTIIGESVAIQDLQNQVDATSRLIARLQKSLADWRALTPTDDTQKHIDSLTAQIERLQRGRASTVRTAQYASVELQLTTRTPTVVVRHHHRGPLHGLAVAFRWAGIGSIYAVALGAPLVLLVLLAWLVVRTTRRRREERLLSRS